MTEELRLSTIKKIPSMLEIGRIIKDATLNVAYVVCKDALMFRKMKEPQVLTLSSLKMRRFALWKEEKEKTEDKDSSI